MNLLTVIYMVAVMGVGFIAGMIVELSIDAETIRSLREQNRKLTLMNQQKKADVVEVINIVGQEEFESLDYSQKW